MRSIQSGLAHVLMWLPDWSSVGSFISVHMYDFGSAGCLFTIDVSLYFFQDAFDVQVLVARSVKHSINFVDVKDLNRLIPWTNDPFSGRSKVAKKKVNILGL